jgi:hypothetical protein
MAEPILRQAGNTSLGSYVLGDLGDKLLWLGDLEHGIPKIDEALSQLRQEHNDWGTGMALGQRAHAALLQGDHHLAAELFAASIETAQELHDGRAVLGAVAGLAGLALAQGEAERAARLLGGVASAQTAMGIGRVGHSLHAARIVEATQATLDPAVFARASAEGRERSLDDVSAEALLRQRSASQNCFHSSVVVRRTMNNG